MEIRENFRTVPSRPIAVALALLAVLALALTTWYVLAPAFAAPSTKGPSPRPCTRKPAVTRTRLTIQSASRQATRTRRTTSSSHVAHTWPSLKAAATHVLDRELRRVGDEHDGHHAGF